MRKKRLTPAEQRAAEKVEAERWDAAVLSHDPSEGVCRGCKAKRVLYQTHVFSEDTVLARCKGCLVAAYGDRVYIRQVGGTTPEVWQQDALKAASEARRIALASHRSKKRLEAQGKASGLATIDVHAADR